MAQPDPYLRNLLLARSEWMEERVLQGARRNGYGNVTPAMNRLFAHMGHRPVGLSELARRLTVSRQAVHQLAREAERLGLVEFVASPDDARVRLLQFSAEGRAMSASAANELRAIEAELRLALGEEDFAALQRILARQWPANEEPAAVARHSSQ